MSPYNFVIRVGRKAVEQFQQRYAWTKLSSTASTHLTERGAMDSRRLYESPVTDLDDQGISGIFPQADDQTIIQVLGDVKQRAAA